MAEKKVRRRRRAPGELPDRLFEEPPLFEADIELIRAEHKTYAPLLRALRRELSKDPDDPTYRFPNPAQWRRVERSVRSCAGDLREQLAPYKGRRVTKAEMDALIRIGLQKARLAALPRGSHAPGQDDLFAANLVQEGTYQLTGTTFVFASPVGGSTVLDISNDDDLASAEIILIVSLTVEALGFVAALAGIFLPKVDLYSLAAKFGDRFRSPAVQRALAALLRILRNGQKSLAEKVEAILKFMNVLSNAGLLTDIIAQILHDLSWWRIALLVVQLIAQIALWLIPGAQAALVAQKGIAIANSVLSLVTKGRDLGDMLTT